MAGGLWPPIWGPVGPMTGEIVGQKDYYKKLCVLGHLKGTIKLTKAKLFIIKIEGLFEKDICA